MIEINAENQPLGRLASKIALILHILADSKVLIHNVGKIKITGKKLEDKKYFHYSGYPGGLKEKKMKDIFEKDPRIILRKAVWGMLPKNRLRKETIKNLYFK